MAKYFKVKTNYLKTDISNENGVSHISEVRLFEAVDYTDAQAQAIQLVNTEGCCGECDIEIQKISYDTILYRDSEGKFALNFVKEIKENLNNDEESIEETYWYDIRVTKILEDDKGNEKYIVVKYLVEGQDLEDSIEVIRSYLKNEDENYWWFSSIQETPIKEVILSPIQVS